MSSSPGIMLGLDFSQLTKQLQVGQLVGWSVFSRLAFGHELYIKAQSIFSPTSLLSNFLYLHL
jgi:hypothetical protein